MRLVTPVALLALSLVACGGSSSTSAASSTTAKAAMPATSASAASGVNNPCPEGRIPAGPNHECLRTCLEVAPCAKGEGCLTTSWEMAPGMIAHDKACF